MVIERSSTDLPMLVSSGPQFFIGGVLECEQRVVGLGQSHEDLVELALRRPLTAGLGVLDNKDHREGDRGHQSLEDGLPPRGKSGHDADDDPHPGPGPATESPTQPLAFAQFPGEFIAAHFRPARQLAPPGDLI
jgi:hypothetical protein